MNGERTQNPRRIAWLQADLHEWVRREAFERRTTIGAELDAAVELLREQRARQEAARQRQAARQQVSA